MHGPVQLEIARLVDRALEVRWRVGEEAFVDVRYRDLVATRSARSDASTPPSTSRRPGRPRRG